MRGSSRAGALVLAVGCLCVAAASGCAALGCVYGPACGLAAWAAVQVVAACGLAVAALWGGGHE